MKSTGWKQYYSAAVLAKNKDLLDRQVSEFCHGSLIFGFAGMVMNTKEFIENVRIDCIQSLRISKPHLTSEEVLKPIPNHRHPTREPQRENPF
jgi:hypothetical protein